METLAQYVISGLVIGIAYALVALGLSIVFGILDIINFAHGEFYMVGAYFTYMFVAFLKLNYFLAVFLSLFAVAILAAVCAKLCINPLRLRPDMALVVMLSTFGLGLALQDLALITWGPVPVVISSKFAEMVIQLGNISLTYQKLIMATIVIAVAIGLWGFIKKSSLGKMMRATAQNQIGSLLVGVNVERIFTVTFTIGAVLSALAGGLLGTITSVYPTVGHALLFKGFISVILGGLGSMPGALAGGLLLGQVEALAGGYISSAYKDIFGFGIVILFLLLRPQGVFGR